MSQTASQPGPADGRVDVAELKRIEALLARMTKVFLDGADPIVIRDLDGNILDVNHETERVFGWTREELVGHRTKHLVAPQFQQQSDEALARIQRGETVRNIESSVRAKSGEYIPVLATAFLLTDEASQPVGYAEIVKDISPLKQAIDQLAHRNRQLQHFADVLAHDLSAPLRSIQYFSRALQTECESGLNDECREHLLFITAGVERLDRLVDDLVKYTRLDRDPSPFHPVDCTDALTQALANLHAAIEENGAVITHEPLPTIVGSKSQLIQLFQNLIGNAIKFRGFEAPRIQISAQRVDRAWQISIRDNGIGIENRFLLKIFEVFQRLHADHVYPGTGMGLAICKTIVQRHGGRIWVESEKGKGSAFHFTIADPPEDAVEHSGELTGQS